MTRWRARVDEMLWGPETGRRLVWVHCGLSALIGLRIALGSYGRLAGIPPELVEPVPFLAFMGAMPPVEVFVALQVVGTVAAAAALLRRNPRWAFAIAWVCYLVLAGLRSSRGKVLHNDLLLLWAAAPFLLAPVRVDTSDRSPRRAYGWPIRVAVVIVALIYFFAGYHKLRRSGPAWVLGDNMRNLLIWGPAIGHVPWEGLARWIADHAIVAKASGAFILGLELSFPVVLVVRRAQVWYALGAVFLHVTTWFVLGLDYWAWAATVMLLLVDWPAVAGRARALRRREAMTAVAG